MPDQQTSSLSFIQAFQADAAVVRAELNAGLRMQPARIAPKYLYDELGSRLFDAICALSEYYPTRTEAGIFTSRMGEIADAAGLGSTLIDLGAGNCGKAARLFPALRPEQYVPVDISIEFLRDAVVTLQQRHPAMPILAVGQDFSTTLVLPDEVRRERRLFFYPGSSIGNFDPQQALAFLRRLHDACDADGGLLIGVDLIKDKMRLDAAYDDALGVTAAFNLNLLLHLNRLLDANFDVRDWRHRAFYNVEQQRIEMHLEARRSTTVHWDGGLRWFEEGERIHTENSYKYTQEQFVTLLEEAGFARVRRWTDPDGVFMVCHAHAA